MSARATTDLAPWLDAAWRNLAARAERGSLPPALLLAGAAGLGKRTFAENFVRARLCRQPRSGQACGECKACALLDAGTHPDRVLVTLEENPNTHKMRTEIVVDQIRLLSARLAMASQMGGWQVAVIDPADAMNNPSFNALLKTLEEPTAASLIVLVADQPWRLPATIRSRCQRIDFATPPRAEAERWLRAQGVRDPQYALDAAGGNPGRALVFAQGDELDRRDSVAKDLIALARGNASVYSIAHAWCADEPAVRLEHAARLLHQAALAQVDGTPGRFDPPWNIGQLQSGFERVNRLRESLRGPLRAEPALIECLAAFGAAR